MDLCEFEEQPGLQELVPGQAPRPVLKEEPCLEKEKEKKRRNIRIEYQPPKSKRQKAPGPMHFVLCISE